MCTPSLIDAESLDVELEKGVDAVLAEPPRHLGDDLAAGTRHRL